MLTVDDVLFSIDRATNMKNTMQQFTASTGTVVAIEKVGDWTIRVRTKDPDPLPPENIGTLYIVQKKAVGDAHSTAFRDPRVAVGTGPFKYVSYSPGDSMELARHDEYWEGKFDFDRITIRFISGVNPVRPDTRRVEG